MKDLSKDAVNRLAVGEDGDGQRIDNFLQKTLKGVPKSHIYRILRSGEVRLNRRRASPDTRLAAGDELRIPPIRTAAPAAAREPRPGGAIALPPVLYEDDALIALDKPSGLAVHGGSGIAFGLIERLRRARPDAPFLELALESRVAAGGERRARVAPGGRYAHTVFRRVQTWPRRVPPLALLDAELMTGRTHQIRVHLTHIGFPLAGDDKYGDFAWNRLLAKEGLKRMFLHAHRIRFAHPADGREIVVTSPLPADLASYLACLDGDGSAGTDA